jgi:hypothetical protein
MSTRNGIAIPFLSNSPSQSGTHALRLQAETDVRSRRHPARAFARLPATKWGQTTINSPGKQIAQLAPRPDRPVPRGGGGRGPAPAPGPGGRGGPPTQKTPTKKKKKTTGYLTHPNPPTKNVFVGIGP